MMNIKKYMGLLVAALALVTLGGCQDSYDAPDLEVPKATMQRTMSILDLKKRFMNHQEETGLSTYRVPELYGTRCVISGYVVSSDATGNIYQSLVIQDETAAIQFSISRASLWSLYPIGQKVVVDVTGMVVGVYGNLIQIGDYYENGGEPQVGRMLYAKFVNQSQLDGLPNDNFKYVSFNSEWPSDRPYIVATTIAEVNELIGDNDAVSRMQSQLVRFQNVHWQDAGKATYAVYEETSRRYILDSGNGSLMAYNSGYSTFYNDLLPEGVGSVEGILSYYGYDGSADNPWQLLLRSTQDVQFGDVPGTRRNPFGVDQVIALDDCGLTAWAEGYIVGAFDFSGNPVFGLSDDLMDDNLLIASDKECRDIASCVCVQLPAGPMRQFANLPDNPAVLGRRLTVNGTFTPYYRMHGILTSGAKSDFAIEGIDIGGGEGSGSADDPYTVGYVLGHYRDSESGVWMAGYIVGFFDASAGVVFGIPAADANYNGANVVVAEDPAVTDPSKCVYVKCDRNAIGLKRNPDNLGKLLKAQGKMMEQNSMAGFDASLASVE